MKNLKAIMLGVLPMLALTFGMFSPSQRAAAQPSLSSTSAVIQGELMQQDGQKPADETKTFSGKIVKSGEKLVLADPAHKTTYELDDQDKAKAFVNKNVKVTGVLDSASGMIHVTAIEPV